MENGCIVVATVPQTRLKLIFYWEWSGGLVQEKTIIK